VTEAIQVIERRNNGTEIIELIRIIHDNQVEMDRKLTSHMENETQELATAITTLMADAFPAGDPGGHRRHHELVIKQAEERAAFWKVLRIEIAKWGLIGFLGWASWSLWNSFLQGPHK
jgi:hypothetical protein